MKKCQYCKAEFQPKNPKGKFCSDKCRVYASRVVKSSTPIIDYTPPPIFTSKENAEKINDAFKAAITPPMPTRNEGEDVFEFALRKSEWKKKYNQ